jgi:hypothetical protein
LAARDDVETRVQRDGITVLLRVIRVNSRGFRASRIICGLIPERGHQFYRRSQRLYVWSVAEEPVYKLAIELTQRMYVQTDRALSMAREFGREISALSDVGTWVGMAGCGAADKSRPCAARRRS